MKVWTIGHSTHSPEQFIEMLKNNEIEVLVDIRSYPGSRRCPHFNKENMSVWLQEAGIDYVHMPKLGGRRNKIKTVDYDLVKGWRHPSFANYAAYALTDEFKEGLRELTQLIKIKRVAYTCSEGTHLKCHRRICSDWLVSKGYEVIHIENGKLNSKHTLMDIARLDHGQVIYPSPQMNMFELLDEQWFNSEVTHV